MQRNTGAAKAGLAAWLAVASMVLVGCGFQPRGQTPQLTGIPTPVYISGLRPYSGLHRELVRQFQSSGTDLVTRASEGGSVLRVHDRSSDSRVLSVDSRNKAVEYELEESVRYSLRAADGRELQPEQTLRAVRIHFRPEDAIIASGREADLLRADMRRELAERMARRLSAI